MSSIFLRVRISKEMSDAQCEGGGREWSTVWQSMWVQAWWLYGFRRWEKLRDWDEQCEGTDVIQESMCDESYEGAVDAVCNGWELESLAVLVTCSKFAVDAFSPSCCPPSPLPLNSSNYIGSSSSSGFYLFAGSCMYTHMEVFSMGPLTACLRVKSLVVVLIRASVSLCSVSWVVFSQGSSLCWELNLTMIILTAVMHATVSSTCNMYISLLLIYFDSSKQILTYCPMNIVRTFITVLKHVEHGNANS